MTDRPRAGSAGISLPVPMGWADAGASVAGEAGSVVPEAAAEEVLAAVAAPYRDGRFTPNVVVTVQDVPSGEPAATWLAHAGPRLADELPRLDVLDAVDVEVAGRPGHRLLAHYPLPAFGGITVEQWLVADGDRGVVLTASVATLEYDEAADLFGDLAADLHIADGTGR